MKVAGGYLLAVLLLAAPLAAQPPAENQPPGRPEADRPRFVDLDGDGFNDLAPDLDGDGIPDALDPMFQSPRARGLQLQYRSIPDSVASDSLAFRAWWEGQRNLGDWQRAWVHWRMMVRDAGGVDVLRERWQREGMSPRELRRRMIEERRRRAAGDTGPGRGDGGGGGGGGGRGGGGPG